MKTLNLKLEAGKESSIAKAGSYIRIMSSTGEIQCRTDEGADVTLEQGIGQPLDPFSRIRLLSATTQTIRVNVGTLKTDDSRMAGDVDAYDKPGSSFAAVPDVVLVATVAKQIAIANSDQLEIHIENTGAGDLRLGDVNNKPAAGSGKPLAAGASCVVKTSAEVWGYSVAGTTASFSILVR